MKSGADKANIFNACFKSVFTNENDFPYFEQNCYTNVYKNYFTEQKVKK